MLANVSWEPDEAAALIIKSAHCSASDLMAAVISAGSRADSFAWIASCPALDHTLATILGSPPSTDALRDGTVRAFAVGKQLMTHISTFDFIGPVFNVVDPEASIH